jgi:hypothetical protein|nr:hypothetical protein [Kofleriaceae bacterium]
MSVATLPIPRSPLVSPVHLAALALSPLAIGAVVAARTAAPSPIFAVPAIVLGVIAATGPALYIASAAVGDAPPLATMARAFVAALSAFGIALAGLVLPTAFVALTTTEPTTAVATCTAAIAVAALCALRRLARELSPSTLASAAVYACWSVATLGIAGRLWWDVASEVLS